MEGIIYMYTSPSGKKYIGQTIQERGRRNCFMNPNKSYGGNKIDRAREKYGPENFDYKVLIRLQSDDTKEMEDTLNKLEIGLIKMYDTHNNGYNATEGGESLKGFHHTEESKAKMSKSKRMMSDETKMKMSEARKGKSPSNKGKSLSEETRQKMKEFRTGKHWKLVEGKRVWY